MVIDFEYAQCNADSIIYKLVLKDNWKDELNINNKNETNNTSFCTLPDGNDERQSSKFS